MRLNKYLAREGIATRRAADELIEKKRVLVNGAVASVGMKVEEGDEVSLRRSAKPREFAYVLFNKPAGVDTHAEHRGTPDALGMLPPELRALRLFPVGRLDKESSGLMLFTNDGRVTDRLLNPAHEHEKTYDVTTREPLRSNFKQRMEEGVNIEGYRTEPAKVEIVNDSRARITLTEGKKHQIRRMVAALGGQVRTLKRVRIMSLTLGTMPEGGHRILSGEPLAAFLESLGLAGAGL
jgi:23S rRNA pseudouridine2604 synthase